MSTNIADPDDERDEAIRAARYDTPQRILESWAALNVAMEAREGEWLRSLGQSAAEIQDTREALARVEHEHVRAAGLTAEMIAANGRAVLSETMGLFVLDKDGGILRFSGRPTPLALAVMPGEGR